MSALQSYKKNLTDFIDGTDFRNFACKKGFDTKAGFTKSELKALSDYVTQYVLTEFKTTLLPSESPPNVKQYQEITKEELSSRLEIYASALDGRELIYPATFPSCAII